MLETYYILMFIILIMFRKEYLEEGREQEWNRLAHRMRDRGMDTTMIADLLGITEEQVETYLAQPVQG